MSQDTGHWPSGFLKEENFLPTCSRNILRFGVNYITSQVIVIHNELKHYIFQQLAELFQNSSGNEVRIQSSKPNFQGCFTSKGMKLF
jgi:hypothetical protein